VINKKPEYFEEMHPVQFEMPSIINWLYLKEAIYFHDTGITFSYAINNIRKINYQTSYIIYLLIFSKQ